MNISDVKTASDFYNISARTGYLVDKYKGRIITDLGRDLEFVVKDIYDLRFEDLDFEDQRLALQVGWAWGVNENIDLNKAKYFKAYLFRPKQFRLFWCKERFPAYIGGFGSGKSHILCLKGIYLSLMYPATHGLLMRATYPQLMDTTIETLFKIFSFFGWKAGQQYNHHVSRKIIELYVGDQVSKIYYRPAKNEGTSIQDIIEDLQSFEIDWAGLDEVVGIDEVIAVTVKNRIGRWGKITKREDRKMMVSGNPPSEGSWIEKRWYLKQFSNDRPIQDPEEHTVFVSSSYENRRNLTKDNIESLEATEEYWRRTFLEGRLGFVPPDGEPVYKNFIYDMYVSEKSLDYNPRLPLIVGYDLGPTAKNKAAVVAQLDSRGILIVLAEFMMLDPGVIKFGQYVIGSIKAWFPEANEIRHFSDPVAFDISQTDGQSPATLLRDIGIHLLPGEEKFQMRYDAVTQVMNRLVDGAPGMRIDGTRCRKLVQGFMGGYRYKVIDLPNDRFSMEPLKDVFSHVHDALQYLCSRLGFVKLKTKDESQQAQKKRDAALRYKRKRLLGQAVNY